MTNMVPSSTICYQQIAAWLKMTDQYDHGTDRYDHGTCVLALEDAEVDISSQDCHCKTSSQIMFLFSHHYQYKAKHPVRLNLSASRSAVFFSHNKSASAVQQCFYSLPNRVKGMLGSPVHTLTAFSQLNPKSNNRTTEC
jgi:hypothetical protein